MGIVNVADVGAGRRTDLAPQDVGFRSSPGQPLLAVWPQTGHFMSFPLSVLMHRCVQWDVCPVLPTSQVWGENQVK